MELLADSVVHPEDFTAVSSFEENTKQKMLDILLRDNYNQNLLLLDAEMIISASFLLCSVKSFF